MKKGYLFVKENIAFILALLFMLFWSGCCAIARRESHTYLKIYVIFAVLIVILFTALYVLIKNKKFSFVALYPVVGLVIGLMYIVNIPIFSVPDEPDHMWKSYHMSNRILGIEDVRDGDDYYLMMRKQDDKLQIKVRDYDLEWFDAYYNETNASDSQEIIKSGKKIITIESYPYFASSLGITFGRLLHLSALKTFLMGRLFNLILFVAIITIAIWILPYGKEIFFAVALLPMCVQEGMSYAYDSWIISHSLLLLALFLSLYEEIKDKRRSKYFTLKFFALLIISLLFITIKSHGYILFCTLFAYIVLLMFLDGKKVTDTVNVLIVVSYIGFVALVALAYLLIMVKPDLLPYTPKIIEWADAPGYTIPYLLHHPGETVQVIYNTIGKQFDYYYRTMIGNSLGWLDIQVNPAILGGFSAALFASTLQTTDGKSACNVPKRLLAWIVLFTFLMINVGMLISWSPIDTKMIVGLQGRYFLPILPMLLLILNTPKIRIDANLKKYLPLLIVYLQFFMLDQIMLFT